MKKTLFAFAIAALSLLVFSCKKDDLGKINPSEESVIENEAGVLTSFTTSVNMEEGTTKMSYDMETGTGDNDGKWRIKKTWDVGDELIGFQVVGEEYGYFTFEATAIDETKNEVTWTRQAGNYTEEKYTDKPKSESGYPSIPTEGNTTTMYLAFAPGVKAYGFSGDGEITMSGSFTSQTDGAQMTIACGEATISSKGVLTPGTFTNQMALFAIVNPILKDVTENKDIARIEIGGVYTSATLGLSGGNLALKGASELGTIKITPKSDETWTATSGTLSKNIFIPVIPNSDEENVITVRIFTKTDEAVDAKYYGYKISNKAIENKAYRVNGKTFSIITSAKLSVSGEEDIEYPTIDEAIHEANEKTSPSTITAEFNLTVQQHYRM